MIVGIVLVFHTEYGTPEAVAEAARKHAYLGFVIILVGLLKAAEVLWRRRFKLLAFSWIALLLAAALMLISYREPEGAYRTTPVSSEPGHFLAPER